MACRGCDGDPVSDRQGEFAERDRQPPVRRLLDRNQAALELVRGYGADHTVLADGSEVDKVLELTDGQSAEVVFDFSASRVPRRRGGT